MTKMLMTASNNTKATAGAMSTRDEHLLNFQNSLSNFADVVARDASELRSVNENGE